MQDGYLFIHFKVVPHVLFFFFHNEKCIIWQKVVVYQKTNRLLVEDDGFNIDKSSSESYRYGTIKMSFLELIYTVYIIVFIFVDQLRFSLVSSMRLITFLLSLS